MITVYTKDFCPYCTHAKNLLHSLGFAFKEVDVTHDQNTFRAIQKKSGMMTVPQVFVGEKCLGGFSDISALHQKGELIPQLQ